MAKLGKSFESVSEERRVLLHAEDPMVQSEPREVLVKINGQDTPVAQRRSNADDVALVCRGNSSFLLRTKTKSRLMDPPEQSHKQLMKTRIVEDDPFLGYDLPEEYQKMKLSATSVVQFVSLVFILAALACNLGLPKFMNKNLLGLEIWKWVSMVLVLISGRFVSRMAIQVVLFFIERNFLLRKRVLYFVYGVRTAVRNCIWSVLVFISWHTVLDKKPESMSDDGEMTIMPLLARIWLCLLVGTLIWLLKTIVVKALASSFHVSKFFDRIQESLFHQYVIETLSGPPRFGIQLKKQVETNVFPKGKVIRKGRYQKKSSRFSGEWVDEGITIDHVHMLNQKNVSAWNMMRLVKMVRKSVLSTSSNDQIDQDRTQITTENQARAAASKIFSNVAKPLAKCIFLEDLMQLLRDDEAFKAMCLIVGANDSKGITKKALKNFMVHALRERRALSLSLDDTKSAVNKLHMMSNMVVGILVLGIWMIILKFVSIGFFVFLGSQFLLTVFVFGNSCKTTFEAIIFLFVTHPFDVGDRCEVNGVQMVVEEMNILTTVFLRHDNQKIIYPNKVLATKPIRNFYRSPDMKDAVDFCIHIATPMEKIALMKERIKRYVEEKSDYWYPASLIVLRDVEDMNRLKFSLWVSHRMNHQDMDEKWVRRGFLIEEMIKIFRELEIEYRMLPIEVHVTYKNVCNNNSAISMQNNTNCSNPCAHVNMSSDQA